MSPFFAYLTPAVFLLLLAGVSWGNSPEKSSRITRALRHPQVTFVLFGIPAVWFLWHVLHLSDADFGQYSTYIFTGFAAVGVLSFFHVRDFLAVRGLAVLILLSSREILDAIYMQYPEGYLFLVSAVYVLIALAIYFGAVPFRLRDFVEWVFKTSGRHRIFSGLCGAYSALLVIFAFQL